MTTETDVHVLAGSLDQGGALDDVEGFYVTMIVRFGGNAMENARLLEELHARLAAMLCGILVMLCGLAVAAIVG